MDSEDEGVTATPAQALAAIDKKLADDVNDFGDVGYSLKLAQIALRQVQDAKCKNCKHWRSFEETGAYGLNTADILKLGLCGKVIDDQAVEPEGQLALSEDCSGLSGLRTAAEFGCVLFEAK